MPPRLQGWLSRPRRRSLRRPRRKRPPPAQAWAAAAWAAWISNPCEHLFDRLRKAPEFRGLFVRRASCSAHRIESFAGRYRQPGPWRRGRPNIEGACQGWRPAAWREGFGARPGRANGGDVQPPQALAHRRADRSLPAAGSKFSFLPVIAWSHSHDPCRRCRRIGSLWVTRTALDIESLIGAIMAISVAVANAILLVTFAGRNRIGGARVRDAAVDGAASRLRPIVMTSSAMISGMLPMAIGLGEAGSQTAPLGRAVIGGLIGSTIATLVILPAVAGAGRDSRPAQRDRR